MRKVDDLNSYTPTQSQPRVAHKGCDVEVVFSDLEAALVAEIKRYPVIVGCMAWLTNNAVLELLPSKEAVSIIVQKEDFLRPDAGSWSKSKIRRLYDAIPQFNRNEPMGMHYSYLGDPHTDPIRCAGISKARDAIPPRMHHKFLVFCDITEPCQYDLRSDDAWPAVAPRMWNPVAVWTGSFNATENATRSLENAMIVRDKRVAWQYYMEWFDILGISEPLDWTSVFVDPEYRVGT